MAGMSGIAVAAEAVSMYNEQFQKMGAPNAILVFEIVREKCIEITQNILFTEVDKKLAEAEAKGFRRVPGEQKEFSLLRYIFTSGDQRPRYATIILRKEDGGKEKVTLITWCPNDANIKKRMLISSSKDALKKALTGIGYAMQACDEDDLCFEDIKKNF